MRKNSEITVRRTNDLDLIEDMNSIIFPGEDLETGNNTYHWIARDKQSGKPVGFCSCSYIGHGILFLSRAGLLRKYRGRGLQKKFISLRESFAKKKEPKITSIITYVKKDNYTSLASLIKRGYRIYTPEWHYAGHEFFYVKKSI